MSFWDDVVDVVVSVAEVGAVAGLAALTGGAGLALGVLQGAAFGALISGTVAAVTGKNIGQALGKGGLIGGVTGGIFQGINGIGEAGELAEGAETVGDLSEAGTWDGAIGMDQTYDPVLNSTDSMVGQNTSALDSSGNALETQAPYPSTQTDLESSIAKDMGDTGTAPQPTAPSTETVKPTVETADAGKAATQTPTADAAAPQSGQSSQTPGSTPAGSAKSGGTSGGGTTPPPEKSWYETDMAKYSAMGLVSGGASAGLGYLSKQDEIKAQREAEERALAAKKVTTPRGLISTYNYHPSTKVYTSGAQTNAPTASAGATNAQAMAPKAVANAATAAQQLPSYRKAA